MAKETAKQIYGILGYPAQHSLSPLMHNAAFKALNIDAEYRIFEINRHDLNNFLTNLSSQNIRGLNITIPYKEEVIGYLGYIHPDARLIQAVNTIKVSQNQLEGFNTDGEGFIRSLCEEQGFNPQAKNIAILGAGGSSKAVSVYLSKSKARKIAVYNRDQGKAQNLVDRLKDNFKDTQFKFAASIAELDIAEADLLVNTTSIGMNPSDPSLVEAKFLHKGLLVYDLVYNSRQTKLVEIALEKGCRAVNGLGMLLCQAMISFQIWTGKKAPKSIMEEALSKVN